MSSSPPLRVREYGDGGPWVIALHGGPAAPGEAAPIARGLAGAFRVLEPWQRGSGASTLTVATHVEDLRALVVARCGGTSPAIVGESWGATLALAFAAAHPDLAGPIVLVGCGTFDKASRARMNEVLAERGGAELQAELRELDARYPDPGERLLQRYSRIRVLYDFDPVEEPADDPEIPPFDARAHAETWSDMLRLQEEGVYPAAFAAIRGRVLMLHGSHDPHPGGMIRASLVPWIPQLEYREWPRCGHSPWSERGVREEFFSFLREWLLAVQTRGGRADS